MLDVFEWKRYLSAKVLIFRTQEKVRNNDETDYTNRNTEFPQGGISDSLPLKSYGIELAVCIAKPVEGFYAWLTP